MKFKDNADFPIAAFDFDGTIDYDNYPGFGEPRKYAIPVIDFLHDIGVRIAIFTSRDTCMENGNITHDDISPMLGWLSSHHVRYDSVNSTFEFAPFKYESRKIYAHMYIDDRAYGFDTDNEYIMLKVLRSFLDNVVGIDDLILIGQIVTSIRDGREIDYYATEECRNYVRTWKSRQ
jgi:hypothetical protein